MNKNDPNDARSVAVAALRSPACPSVRADDHAAVLKVWAKRHRDLSRARNQVVCRLHAVLCELVPGGVSKQIRAAAAARLLEQIQPAGAVQAARRELAGEFLADLRRIDAQRRDTRRRLAAAVRASGTSVTEVFGVGPAVAAAVPGDVRDISRFPGPDCFAAYNGTAPGRGVLRRPGHLPAVAAREPAAEPRHPAWPRSPRSATGTPRAAPITTRNSRGQDSQREIMSHCVALPAGRVDSGPPRLEVPAPGVLGVPIPGRAVPPYRVFWRCRPGCHGWGIVAYARVGKLAKPASGIGAAVNRNPVGGSRPSPVRCSTTEMPARGRIEWAGRRPPP